MTAIDITGVSTEGKSPIAEIDDEKLAELSDVVARFTSVVSRRLPDDVTAQRVGERGGRQRGLGRE